jgi:cell wall-associated NlpC family hydrolase
MPPAAIRWTQALPRDAGSLPRPTRLRALAGRLPLPHRLPASTWLLPLTGMLIAIALIVPNMRTPTIDLLPPPAKTAPGRSPVALAPGRTGSPASSRADLEKVRSALRALRMTRAQLAAQPGESVTDLDLALRDLTRSERAMAVGRPVMTAPASMRTSSASRSAPERQAAADAIAYARAQLGKPYIYGGAGPRGYDCSGLTMMAYKAAGVSIPRTADVQYWQTHHVAQDKLRAGDLVFFDYHRGMSGPGHVGIVIDPKRHLMIVAPHTGTVVKIQNYLTVGQADGLVGFSRPTQGKAIHAPRTHPARPSHTARLTTRTAHAPAHQARTRPSTTRPAPTRISSVRTPRRPVIAHPVHATPHRARKLSADTLSTGRTRKLNSGTAAVGAARELGSGTATTPTTASGLPLVAAPTAAGTQPMPAAVPASGSTTASAEARHPHDHARTAKRCDTRHQSERTGHRTYGGGHGGPDEWHGTQAEGTAS